MNKKQTKELEDTLDKLTIMGLTMDDIEKSKPVLFDFNQVIELAKHYKHMHESDDMSDYEHGVVSGIEFVLFLVERCEK